MWWCGSACAQRPLRKWVLCSTHNLRRAWASVQHQSRGNIWACYLASTVFNGSRGNQIGQRQRLRTGGHHLDTRRRESTPRSHSSGKRHLDRCWLVRDLRTPLAESNQAVSDVKAGSKPSGSLRNHKVCAFPRSDLKWSIPKCIVYHRTGFIPIGEKPA